MITVYTNTEGARYWNKVAADLKNKNAEFEMDFAQKNPLAATIATNLKNLLWQCFVTDKDLIAKWHYCAGQGICVCVNDTLKELESCDKITVFALKNQFTGDTAGYFGIEEHLGDFFLTGFFLKPEYRTPEHRKQFWEQVWQKAFECGLSQKDGGGLISAVYAKNEPANRFLSTWGSLVRSVNKDVEEPYNIYIVCQ